MIFSPTEESEILEAIRTAERNSTGEIRLYVEDFCLRDSPVERAEELFQLFGMFNTQQRNGVLIYLAEKSRHFAVWGDVGIHQAVGNSFWEAEKKLLREHLQNGQAAQGVRLAIEQVGERLRRFFPADPSADNDNELPDDIIYG